MFLRALEYYSGILFLTTNKVGKFDEAFISRIHMSINYPPLDQDTTAAIWVVNMRRTKELKPHISFDENDLMACGREIWWKQMNRANGITWNGRQIRNAFQTAVALAEYDTLGKGKDVPLNDQGVHPANLVRAHFMRVSDVSFEFDNYLRKTHRGMDLFTQSSHAQDRADPRYENKPQQRTAFANTTENAYGHMNATSNMPYGGYPGGAGSFMQPNTNPLQQNQNAQQNYGSPPQPYGQSPYGQTINQQVPPASQYAQYQQPQNPFAPSPQVNQYMAPDLQVQRQQPNATPPSQDGQTLQAQPLQQMQQQYMAPTTPQMQSPSPQPNRGILPPQLQYPPQG